MVVKIESSKDVTVLALSQKLRSSDTTIVYPYRSLGKKYIIVTPELGPLDSVKECMILSIKTTSLIILLKGEVKFEGKTYKPNTTLTIKLKELEAVQLQSKDDLSGTQIISTEPVAVITGHSCSWKYTKCDHVNEQLLPVDSWGTNFMVQPLSLQSKGDLIYIVAHKATQVDYQLGLAKNTASLQAGQVLKIDNKNTPLKINSKSGIEVMFFSTGSMTTRRLTYDTFLMNIPSVTDYCKSYRIYGQRGFINYAMIIIKTSSTAALTFDKIPIRNLKWVSFADTGYSYSEYEFGDSLTSHLVEHPSEPFGLMSVGVTTLEAYGSQASCIEAATCTNILCEKDHICKMVDGMPRCIDDSVSTCVATGDPHYTTLDGRRFDMQGTCTYTILKSCEISGQLPSFNVEAKNQNRGNKKVAYVTIVKVQAYGQNISIKAMERGRVWVNGVKSGLPVTLVNGKVYVYHCGSKAVVKLEFGLTVSYDWISHLQISIKDSYTESVCGLCGNKNKDPKDDFLTPTGKQASNPEEFAESWKVEDGDPHCWHDCNGKCNDCPPGHAKRKEAEGFCGLIGKATTGPFSECHAKINPQTYLDNCIYDVCLNKGDKQASCQSLKVYADICQSAGVKIADWRKAAGCALDCGPNSQYKLCGTACPNTCEDDTASTKCSDHCVESCECNEGFVLTLGKCVPKSTCGCTYKGLPYIQNQVFWEDDKCERRCTCNPTTKQVECRAAQCKASEKCGTVNGVRGCYPVGYGTCSTFGDPHYCTFDGQRFDYQGDCIYQFSALRNKTVDLVDFQVNVQNEHRGSKLVTFTRTVELIINGLVIVISKQFPGTVMLNSQRINLPYHTDDDKLSMYKAGSNVVVKCDNGITLTFDCQTRITLKIPRTYAGFLAGLCGDFDGDKTNDLTLKNGAKAPNPTTFGDSWKTRDIPGCKGGAPPPTCPNLQYMKDSQRSSGTDCGVLLKKDGPFRNCHSKVDPEGYFEDCVYDSCFFTGRQATFCQTLASYVAACQAAGAQVESWRTETFCRKYIFHLPNVYL
ncbi:IgGFc-binding protein-like [Lissotriton helveticus]